MRPRLRSPKLPFSFKYWLRRLQVWAKFDFWAAGNLPESITSDEPIVPEKMNRKAGIRLEQGIYLVSCLAYTERDGERLGMREINHRSLPFYVRDLWMTMGNRGNVWGFYLGWPRSQRVTGTRNWNYTRGLYGVLGIWEVALCTFQGLIFLLIVYFCSVLKGFLVCQVGSFCILLYLQPFQTRVLCVHWSGVHCVSFLFLSIYDLCPRGRLPSAINAATCFSAFIYFSSLS